MPEGIRLCIEPPTIRVHRGLFIVRTAAGDAALFPHDFLRLLKEGQRAIAEWDAGAADPVQLRATG